MEEWVNATEAIPSINSFLILYVNLQLQVFAKAECAGLFIGTEGTPDSANPSVVDDEEGLPSPPLDEGFLFSTQPTMELSDVWRSHFFYLFFVTFLLEDYFNLKYDVYNLT